MGPCSTDRLPLSDSPTKDMNHLKNVLFVEIFAGSGRLTAAVKRAGMSVLPPDEAAMGGTDFLSASSVDELMDWVKWKIKEKYRLEKEHFDETGEVIIVVFHIVPPCSTFSKARDRSWRTRVRSRLNPSGFRPRSLEVRQANVIARRAITLARKAVQELDAIVTMENPDRNYIWQYGTRGFGSP